MYMNDSLEATKSIVNQLLMKGDMHMTKILILDDEKTILDNLTFILELEDYDVLSASSGAEGLELFKKNPEIEAVVTDMRMPGMTGMDVLKAVREVNSEMGVIILTGHGDMDNAVSAMKEGAYDYLNKPVNADKLLINLENAIKRYRLQSENRKLQADILKKNIYLQGLHDSAQQILIKLVPPNPMPKVQGVKTSAIYKSCDEVGGDMYDVFEMGDETLFYIFDVCSHGILAAVITMILKSYFDNLKHVSDYSQFKPDLSLILKRLNDDMKIGRAHV